MKIVIDWVCLQVPTARLTCSYQDLTFAGACPELGEYVVRAGAGAGAETDHGNGVMGSSHIANEKIIIQLLVNMVICG